MAELSDSERALDVGPWSAVTISQWLKPYQLRPGSITIPRRTVPKRCGPLIRAKVFCGPREWLGPDLALTPHLYNVLVYALFGSPVVPTCFCVGSVPWYRYSSLPGRCISQVLLAGCHMPHFCFFFYFFLCVLGRPVSCGCLNARSLVGGTGTGKTFFNRKSPQRQKMSCKSKSPQRAFGPSHVVRREHRYVP